MSSLERLDQNFRVADVADGLAWYDAQSLDVEGQGWTATEDRFDRLPARAKAIVRAPVWELSRHSAGLVVRFATDAPEIHARWTVRSTSLAMDHMAATGVSGLDLYAWDTDRWRWAGVGRPNRPDRAEQAGPLAVGLRPASRTFQLYLPLYNGVRQAWIGVPEGCAFGPAALRPADRARPVCVYGTSIVQGGCASRPGMAYPAVLGRRLDLPVLNFGFSGNGPMDLELASLLAELDPAAYVVDALPNMSAELVAERAAPFVAILRRARPSTPVVLVENIVYQRAPLLDPKGRTHEAKNAALRQVFRDLVASGMTGLSLVRGDLLLGDDGEATVDGTHPTDVGFLRIAAALEPVLRDALRKGSGVPCP